MATRGLLRRRLADAAGAALVVLAAAGCTGGEGSAGGGGAGGEAVSRPVRGADTLASTGGARPLTPYSTVLGGVPVWLLLPLDHVVELDGRGERLQVRTTTGGMVVTVLAYDAVFAAPAVPGDAPRLPEPARVTPPPADVVGWLARDPALELAAVVPVEVGGLPATQVDVTSVRAGPCAGGRCAYVVGSPDADAAVRYLETDRFFFLDPPGGARLVIQISTPKRSPEWTRAVWEPLLDSLVVG